MKKLITITIGSKSLTHLSVQVGKIVDSLKSDGICNMIIMYYSKNPHIRPNVAGYKVDQLQKRWIWHIL